MFDATRDIADTLRNNFRTGFGDPILDGALFPNGAIPELYGGPALTQAVEALGADPTMEPLLPREGEFDPSLSTAMGGSRQDFRGLVKSLVASALRIMYFDSAEQTHSVLIEQVLRNYESLKRVARGEPISVRIIHGIGGVILPPEARIVTPWGTVTPAPQPVNPVLYGMNAFRPPTTALLLRDYTTTVAVSRDEFPRPAPDAELFATAQRITELLPLSFALAIEGDRHCAPMLTFTTAVQPFTASFGATSSGRLGPPWQQTTVEKSDVPAVEDWARRINSRHVENLQVTARRIVSAIAERTDRSDALVDAVMAWESLVGTKNETVFRVTAALSKLLATSPSERRSLRRELANTYDIRSRVVHGDVVDDGKVSLEADNAIEVALSATRALYRRAPEWLTYTSNERADRLILEE
ncbi:hypothetical protein CELD12_25510 [Cellulomonas sp. NTE-D12]|nr:hypothetical protein CELD12_25510 [Cellulomonas sp. NTE-D12]